MASFGKLASQLNVATRLHFELVGVAGVKGCVVSRFVYLANKLDYDSKYKVNNTSHTTTIVDRCYPLNLMVLTFESGCDVMGVATNLVLF